MQKIEEKIAELVNMLNQETDKLLKLKKQLGENPAEQIEIYFKQLRENENSHMGLGDIRLTIAQQDEIVEMAQGIVMKPK